MRALSLLWSALLFSVFISPAWSQTQPSQVPQAANVAAQCASIGMGQRLCVFNALNAQLWWVDSGGERETVWVSDYYRVGDWSLSADGQYVLVEAFGFGGPQHIAVVATENFFAEGQPVLPIWQQTYQMIGDASQQSTGQVMGWMDEGFLVLESFGQTANGSANGRTESCLRWITLPDPRSSRSLCGQAIGRLQNAEEAITLWRRFSPE